MPRRRIEDFVLITGFSGAGKSQAMATFEDAGYFCVDNLPPEMISSLADLFEHEGSKVERAAVVCDVRGGEYFEHVVKTLDELKERGTRHRVLFLTASEEVLVNRYKETRRRHPLAPGGQVSAGIQAERELLEPLRERADVQIDTSDLTATRLRRVVADKMLAREVPDRLDVTFMSFGFKHGTPRDPDLTFDVRFLPNPHFVDRLRPLTGREEEVAAYVLEAEETKELLEDVQRLLTHTVPRYEREGKAYLTIAVGCTGGRHRSVAIAEHLASWLRQNGHQATVAHRDVERR